MYTLSELPHKLLKMAAGDLFMIKGNLHKWELYDHTPDFFWIRNTISKQKILIQKLK